MKYFKLIAPLAAAVLLLSPASGHAMSITDLDQTDRNVITGTIEDGVNNELLVFEDYNELHLVPYPSHDGYGIVNAKGGFFDKLVTFTADDLGGPWALDFRVTNTTPWCWSDYHFEFWNEDFTQRLASFPLLLAVADLFQNQSFDGQTLAFWAPDEQCPGQTQQFVLTFDPALVNGGAPGSFGIRQVATTVPEPMTMLGLFLGLSGLGAYLRRRAGR